MPSSTSSNTVSCPVAAEPWRFDPARYPGRRPDGPVLVTDDAEVAVSVTGAVPALPGSVDVRWSVAYGANADPDRLRDKGLTAEGALLLPAVLVGWVTAFEQRRTGYGAVPLTLVPSPARRLHTWVVGIPAGAVDELDRTEGRAVGGAPSMADPAAGSARHAPPGTYQLGYVGRVDIAGAWVLPAALAYLPGPATRVQVVDGAWRTWPESDQAAARAHLESGGASEPAPLVTAPVLGPWPSTPLLTA